MPVPASPTSPRATVVVIATPDGAACARSLDSVLAQSERALEVIVAAGSEAGVPPEAAPAGDPRVRTLAVPGAQAAALYNRALAEARAPWVKLVPAGDELEASCLARELAALDAAPSARAVVSHPRLLDGDGRPPTDPAMVRRFTPAARDGAELARELFERRTLASATVLFSRDAVLALGGFDEELALLHEHDLWLRLCHTHDVVVLPEPLVRVRERPSPAPDPAVARAERADSAFRVLAELRKGGWQRVIGDAGADPALAARRLVALARSVERAGLLELRPFALELLSRARALDDAAGREPALGALRGVTSELGRPPAWRDGTRAEPATRGALVPAMTALRRHLERLGNELDEVTRAATRSVDAIEDLGVEAASARTLVERGRGVTEQVLGKLQIKRRLTETASALLGRPRVERRVPRKEPSSAQPSDAAETAQARAELATVLVRHPDRRGTVLFAPTLRWSHELFQRPHQLARELARQGYLVFYCESLWPEPGEPTFRELGERLYVAHAPLPAYAEIEAPIVFFLAYNAFDTSPLRNARVVYELIDELHVFRGDPAEIRRNHEHLLDTADVVVATARKLHRQVAGRRPDALLVPNAVDYDHFRQSRDPSLPLPPELAAVLQPGRRVVGYYGALASWLDYELVRFAALARPDLEFVLIGPDYDGSLETTDVLSLDNVHRLDSQPYAALPRFLRAFDVATIPFVVNDITESTSPIKLFEYAVGGKPIVSTAMQECLRYPGVLVARDGEELVAQIERALTLAGDPSYLATLDAVARDNTWAARVAQLRTALETTPPGLAALRHSHDAAGRTAAR